MSKKDYIRFAKAVKEVNEHYVGISLAQDAVRQLADRIVNIFAEDNGNFNTNKFMEACGL